MYTRDAECIPLPQAVCDEGNLTAGIARVDRGHGPQRWVAMGSEALSEHLHCFE